MPTTPYTHTIILLLHFAIRQNIHCDRHHQGPEKPTTATAYQIFFYDFIVYSPDNSVGFFKTFHSFFMFRFSFHSCRSCSVQFFFLCRPLLPPPPLTLSLSLFPRCHRCCCCCCCLLFHFIWIYLKCIHWLNQWQPQCICVRCCILICFLCGQPFEF